MLCIKCRKDIPSGSIFCMYCGRKQKTDRSIGKKSRGNGTGSVRKLPNGKYKAIVTLSCRMEDGKLRRRCATKTFAKRSDAVLALAGMIENKNASKYSHADATVMELYDAYIASEGFKALSGSQQSKMGYAHDKLSEIDFKPITALTVADLQDAIDNATDKYYPARDMKVLLSHLYKIAMKREIVQTNKAEMIDLPEAPAAKRQCWSKDEVDAMWADYASGNSFTGYILIMCYAGLRYGELSTILIDNIHIAEDYMIGGIKTDAGRNREIPIHHRIKPIIERFMIGKKKKLLEMNDDNFYAKYWDMVSRTGIREYPPQTCRHYYFTSMTAAGVQGGIIAETGGHANYSTTMKNYVRIPIADKLRAVETIE